MNPLSKSAAAFAGVISCIAPGTDAFVCRSPSPSPAPQASMRCPALHASTTGESIVERCFDAWNRREIDDAVACFVDDFEYDDGQYLGSIEKKSDLERLLQIRAKALSAGSITVVDHLAECTASGNIGAQWHVEKEDGTIVPYTRGCSFYTVDGSSGLIKTGFHVSEMIAKPSKQMSDMVVSSASSMLQVSNLLGGLMPSSSNAEVDEAEPASIIEKYFQAWNARDMEAALDCFVEDCVYETEDPVFVDSFRGKEALRAHLLKNADTLPSACRIILDDLAIDTERGTSGVKWHLEVGGVAIPNLRGCSMYTIEAETGLLKSGYDVTEAPAKLPGLAQEALAGPFGKLLF